MSVVLVINSGSSSLKYQLIEVAGGTTLATGLIERIGEASGGHAKHRDETTDAAAGTWDSDVEVPDHSAAFDVMLDAFASTGPSLDIAQPPAQTSNLRCGAPANDLPLSRERRCSLYFGLPVLWEFLERVEDLEPGSLEVSVVSRSNRQPVSSRRCRDVAVLDGHPLARLFGQSLLLRPDVRHRYVEPVDTVVKPVHQPCEPPCNVCRCRPSFIRTQYANCAMTTALV